MELGKKVAINALKMYSTIKLDIIVIRTSFLSGTSSFFAFCHFRYPPPICACDVPTGTVATRYNYFTSFRSCSWDGIGGDAEVM